MEKTLFTIVLLAWLYGIIVALSAFNQITFMANLFGDEEFMKYFMQYTASSIFLIAILFISCLLDFPIVDKIWLFLQ